MQILKQNVFLSHVCLFPVNPSLYPCFLFLIFGAKRLVYAQPNSNGATNISALTNLETHYTL